MNENMISSSGKADLDRVLGQSPGGLPEPARTQPEFKPPEHLTARQQSADKAAAVQAEARTEHSAAEQKTFKLSSPLSDVSLKFRVDAKTNEVSILILDRATRKVLRTIPADEMSKMNPGDLLELFT